MPRFDQTGPEGQGSMTGRKMGKCTNFGGKTDKKETDRLTEEMLQGRGFGRIFGFGGRGTGRRRGGGQGLWNKLRGRQQ
jgi:hypothetical protein